MLFKVFQGEFKHKEFLTAWHYSISFNIIDFYTETDQIDINFWYFYKCRACNCKCVAYSTKKDDDKRPRRETLSAKKRVLPVLDVGECHYFTQIS